MMIPTPFMRLDTHSPSDVDLLTTGFAFHKLVHDYGRHSDPLFLRNSPYFRASAGITALLFLPFNVLMTLRLLVWGHPLPLPHERFMWLYSWTFACIMFLNMTVILSIELYHYANSTPLAPQLAPMLATVGAYWVAPLVLAWQLKAAGDAAAAKQKK